MQWLHDMSPFKSPVSCNVRILFASNCARNRAPVLWHTYCLKLQQSQTTNHVHSYHFVTTFSHHLSFSRSACSRASRSAWWPANVLQLSMEKEATKVTKASAVGFKDVQHLAQLCTTIHFRIGQIYILAAGLPCMRGVNAHYTVTLRKFDLMCFVIAPTISWPVFKKSGPNWSSRMNAFRAKRWTKGCKR
jgi:hypothetical protein